MTMRCRGTKPDVEIDVTTRVGRCRLCGEQSYWPEPTPASPHEIDWKYAFGVLVDAMFYCDENDIADPFEMALDGVPEGWRKELDELACLRLDWRGEIERADAPQQPL